MKQNWEKLGFVLAGKYRSHVVEVLKEGPRTPKKISQQTGLYLSHVSKTLKELVNAGLVECLTPNLRRGRIYGLTSIGTEIAEQISDYQA